MHWWRGETPPGGDERGATTRWSKNPKKDQLDMVGSLSCHALRTASVAASGINASDLPPVTSTSTLDGHCFLDSKIGQGVEGFEDSACSVSLHFRPYPPPPTQCRFFLGLFPDPAFRRPLCSSSCGPGPFFNPAWPAWPAWPGDLWVRLR